MAKVSQEVSFTVNLGDYNNAKVVLGIHDIDTEDDVDKQLQDSKVALGKAFVKLFVLADKELHKIKYSDEHWTVILTEELGEVAREVYEGRSAGMFEEIIQCAAVSFAWAEAYLNRNSGVAIDEN